MTKEGRNIVITGLTKAQTKMLDIMWSLDTVEEYEAWFATLGPAKKHQAEVLAELLKLAHLDNMVEEDGTVDEEQWPGVGQILDRFIR